MPSKKHIHAANDSTAIIRVWLRDAAGELAEAGIASALLDAEIILAHTLRQSRTWLHAHDDETLSDRELEIANARLQLRLDRTPIAYIIGHKEFYGRLFKVTPAVLIPRPESEDLITLLKKLRPARATTLIDVGTGSGCLGITAKCELPDLDVTLADISRHALVIAKENASALHADVNTIESNLLDVVPGAFDIIIANLPYVDRSWKRSPETDAEPELALFADDGGLALIHRLVDQAKTHLTENGLLLLEADPEQHEHIVTQAEQRGFKYCEALDYILAFTK